MPERLVDFFRDVSHDPWLIAILAFLGASFAGLASQLRAGGDLNLRIVMAAMLNSGFIGMIIALMGYSTFKDNLPALFGLSLLSGIGGATILDFVFEFIKHKSGITIHIEKDKP